MKAAHHRGPHQRLARIITARANSNAATVCGQCGLTLAQHPPTKTGKPPRWTAGHVVAGQVGGPYQPEVESCNKRDGAILGNRMREPHSERW